MSEDEIRKLAEQYIEERSVLDLCVASALTAKADLDKAERLRNEAAERMKTPARMLTLAATRDAATAEAKYRSALEVYQVAKDSAEKHTKFAEKTWESLVGVSA